MNYFSILRNGTGLIQMASWTSNDLTKQYFGDLSVNETETYGVNFCKIAHDFKN